MPAENYTNDVATTLSGNGGSVSAGTGTWLVTSSAGFPAVPFRVLCDSEIVLVTNVASFTWTVTRAQENTTGAFHLDGATVRHVVTAAGLKDALDYAVRWTVVPVSGTSYSADTSPRRYYKVDTTAGNFSFTLPDATTCNGLEIAIEKTSTDDNLLTVGTTAAQTIAGDLTQEWNDQYTVMTVVSDGAGWRIT